MIHAYQIGCFYVVKVWNLVSWIVTLYSLMDIQVANILEKPVASHLLCWKLTHLSTSPSNHAWPWKCRCLCWLIPPKVFNVWNSGHIIPCPQFGFWLCMCYYLWIWLPKWTWVTGTAVISCALSIQGLLGSSSHWPCHMSWCPTSLHCEGPGWNFPGMEDRGGNGTEVAVGFLCL
jgi:hypothetical protein